MEVTFTFDRLTREFALYKDNGGFNKQYVPKRWYAENGEPEFITISITPGWRAGATGRGRKARV